ncbi:hypothetical protein [Streptomyces sp. SLBN-115]|nr:hypothetical protein [Streptomyces sp. SLBN-115]
MERSEVDTLAALDSSTVDRLARRRTAYGFEPELYGGGRVLRSAPSWS